MSELVTKISPATIGFNSADLKKFATAPEKPMLFQIGGIARKVIRGVGGNGEWTGFKGNFVATNLISGEVFSSGKCFLPSVVTDMLADAVESPDCDGVQFAFNFRVKPMEKGVGYSFTAEPVVKIRENDELIALKDAMQKSLPNLETATTTTESSTAKAKKH